MKLTNDELHDAVKNMVSMGLQGLECYCTYNTPEETQYYLLLAKEFNLFVSGGSDFHGKDGQNRKLGCVENGTLKLLPKMIDTDIFL
jgi:predicted metal-dependent phosphoesterase TrpH